MANKKKPPLGVITKYLHKEIRLNDLREAISRYMEEYFPVDTAWIEEYNELAAEIKRHGTTCTD